MTPIPRRRFLAVAGLAAVAGCSSRTPASGQGSTPTPTDTTGTVPPAGDASVPTADERLPLPTSPAKLREAARSGGPPKDGIPSIDDPKFVAAADATYLDPGDPVFGVVSDGVVKAYPQKILVWHEIVNDNLADRPVSVTYCPLTGTVQGFERGTTTFGVSGRLINNNLVMYDRATETWWPQILATAIPGPWNDDPEIKSLQEFRLIWTTWKRWRAQHPQTQVLSTDTGFAKNYNRDPYGTYNPRAGYYDNDNLLFPAFNPDSRYERKTVVMGARTPNGAVAFLKRALRANKLMTGTIGDMPVLAVHDSRFDTGYIYLNPEEAAFEMENGMVAGPDGTHTPDALPLDRIHTFDAMWFAWAGYYPETTVYD
ncbi:DUF3179 domain-containing protein [Halorarius litoreus]|jgi:hypothetical protein|uniref:DUF3179 domain-containing protein n=1 Tax=Halorarius litoreus TaxID=2962676 RepID=UPI0020CC541B|nr:DUF3179 domain-containing protein [Halorarius litoreus]